MGKFRIVIEGEGPHHTEGGSATDANKVAKDTVDTLVAMGHKVETAEFEFDHAGEGEEAEFQSFETLIDLPGDDEDEGEPVGTGAATLGEGTGAAADAEAGSGDKPE